MVKNPVVSYVADGQSIRFDYPFVSQLSNQLYIFLDGEQVNSGFKIIFYGEFSGGTVEFNTPPKNGSNVRLQRKVKEDLTP